MSNGIVEHLKLLLDIHLAFVELFRRCDRFLLHEMDPTRRKIIEAKHRLSTLRLFTATSTDTAATTNPPTHTRKHEEIARLEKLISREETTLDDTIRRNESIRFGLWAEFQWLHAHKQLMSDFHQIYVEMNMNLLAQVGAIHSTTLITFRSTTTSRPLYPAYHATHLALNTVSENEFADIFQRQVDGSHV